MNTPQIVLKTIVTTIDLLLAIAVIKSDEAVDGLKKAFAVVVLLNITGVWI